MRIFILGPCHYLYLRSCGLSSMKEYKTPLGNIQIDTESFFLSFCNLLYENLNQSNQITP